MMPGSSSWQDKWDFGLELERLGLPAIPARLGSGLDRLCPGTRPPLLLKPRQGNGSRGIAVLHDEDDFNYWSRKSKDAFLIQKFIGSDEQEFTVGASALAMAPRCGRSFFAGNCLSPATRNMPRSSITTC